MTARTVLLLVVVMVLAGCSSPAAPDDESPAPAEFDLALVRSHFTDECTHPTFEVDEACQQMDIDGMTADGSILNIPTGLNPSNGDRAEGYCLFPASVHYGGPNGEDLGYRTIRILDYNGGILAECHTFTL